MVLTFIVNVKLLFDITIFLSFVSENCILYSLIIYNSTYWCFNCLLSSLFKKHQILENLFTDSVVDIINKKR